MNETERKTRNTQIPIHRSMVEKQAKKKRKKEKREEKSNNNNNNNKSEN